MVVEVKPLCRCGEAKRGKTADHYYRGKKYFIADNGEFGYTAMLPEEY